MLSVGERPILWAPELFYSVWISIKTCTKKKKKNNQERNSIVWMGIKVTLKSCLPFSTGISGCSPVFSKVSVLQDSSLDILHGRCYHWATSYGIYSPWRSFNLHVLMVRILWKCSKVHVIISIKESCLFLMQFLLRAQRLFHFDFRPCAKRFSVHNIIEILSVTLWMSYKSCKDHYFEIVLPFANAVFQMGEPLPIHTSERFPLFLYPNIPLSCWHI